MTSNSPTSPASQPTGSGMYVPDVEPIRTDPSIPAAQDGSVMVGSEGDLSVGCSVASSDTRYGT